MLRVLCLAVILVAPTPARADCACAPGTAYVPAPGTTVPTNAKLWSFHGAAPVISIDDAPVHVVSAARASDDTTRLDPGELRPLARYTYADGSAFWTGRDADVEPPPPPEVRAIELAAGAGQVEVHLDAGLVADAALLRITFRIGTQNIAFVTLPDGVAGIGKPACGTMLPLHAGDRVAVAISALDLAGNESDGVERDVTVQEAASADPACGVAPDHRHGGNLLVGLLVVLAVVVGGLVALGLGLAMLLDLFQRSPAAADGATPLSLLVVERIARRKRHVGAIYALALGVATVAIGVRAPILGSILAAFAGVGVAAALRASRLLAVIGSGDAAGELVGVIAVVRGPTGGASLAMSRQELEAARDLAVPSCIVYK